MSTDARNRSGSISIGEDRLSADMIGLKTSPFSAKPVPEHRSGD
jgi:hypothetical protein